LCGAPSRAISVPSSRDFRSTEASPRKSQAARGHRFVGCGPAALSLW
jgi:hypothetical protein